MASSNTTEIIRPRRAPNTGGSQVEIIHTDGERHIYVDAVSMRVRTRLDLHRREHPDAIVARVRCRIISGYLTA